MSAVLADTHAIIWYLTQHPKLSPAAERAMDNAIATGAPIYVASISLVEVIFWLNAGACQKWPTNGYDRNWVRPTAALKLPRSMPQPRTTCAKLTAKPYPNYPTGSLPPQP